MSYVTDNLSLDDSLSWNAKLAISLILCILKDSSF